MHISLSLKNVRDIKDFCIPNCHLKINSFHGNGTYIIHVYLWFISWPHDGFIQSRHILRCLIATVRSVLLFGSVQMLTVHACIWLKYVFLHFLMFSLIFMNMQMSHNSYNHTETVYIFRKPTRSLMLQFLSLYHFNFSRY